VFGRSNFVANIIWQKTTSARNDALYFSASHDHLLVYAKNKESLLINGLPRTTASETAYSNPDNDPRGPWREGDYKCAKSADERPNLYYPIVHPFTGQEVWPRRNRVWAYSSDVCRQHMEDNLLWWGRTGNYTFPKLKRFRANAPETLVPTTLWLAEDVDQTRKARLESIALFPDDPFPTPKPERLISRIVQIASNPGDIVLDSFLGSGTTCAVAHKLRRRWIGIELQQHAITHCVPRMKKVIDGEDLGGITSVANWTGGGGYRFYRLATSLLDKDKWGNWVVSKEYQPEMLAEAMCKLEGFSYAPHPDIFWIHGYSTETDLIYVTTQNLSHEQLQFISNQVGDERTLLICCSAFRAKPDAFANLTLKKIPKTVLHRCEWGRDDYSLAINKLPAPEATAASEAAPMAGATDGEPSSRTTRKARAKKQYRSLFEEGEK